MDLFLLSLWKIPWNLVATCPRHGPAARADLPVQDEGRLAARQPLLPGALHPQDTLTILQTSTHLYLNESFLIIPATQCWSWMLLKCKMQLWKCILQKVFPVWQQSDKRRRPRHQVQNQQLQLRLLQVNFHLEMKLRQINCDCKFLL